MGGHALRAARARATAAEDALVAAVDRAKVAAARDSAALVVAKDGTDRAVDTLHAAIVQYDTLRRTLELYPTTARDTAATIAALPAFVAKTDGAIAGWARLEAAAARERIAADALDARRQRTIALQDSLLARTAPRLSAVGQVRYDPLVNVPALAARVDVRAVGAWSVGVLAEYRLVTGERPRLYATLSHPLF